jgi:tyrosyl-tRNA synthetase
VPEYRLERAGLPPGPVRLDALLHQAGLAASNRKARSLIEQGGVRRNGTVVSDPATVIPVDELDGSVVQVGRRKWARIRVV